MTEYYKEPRNVLANGLTLLQINPDYAADLQAGSRTFGWLFTRGLEPDQWVTVRKLSPPEVEEAYEQSSDMAVLRIVRVG